jgi:hypothetical protein
VLACRVIVLLSLAILAASCGGAPAPAPAPTSDTPATVQAAVSSTLTAVATTAPPAARPTLTATVPLARSGTPAAPTLPPIASPAPTLARPFATPAPRPPTGDASLHPVGDTRWWIVPFAPGFGSQREGRLYLGVLLENTTDEPIEAAVAFYSYRADGTPFTACAAHGSVIVSIAPRERAHAVCDSRIVPLATAGLQVTHRVEAVTPLRPGSMAVEVVSTNFGPEGTDGMINTFQASALLRARGQRDVASGVLFRFYAEDGTQVATCEPDLATVRPEIAVRVACFVPLGVDVRGPQPVKLRVDPLPVRSG